MKKHENAIKALMKNVKDNEKWYGYFEDGNGARYLTNGHLIIKLFNTYSTVTTDFVGDLPRLNDTKFLNKLVDFVEAHKNGDYKIQLHMSNIKMWDKYNDTDNCYKLEYDNNKYIGFSADYMKRLYTLTGDNCITIIDSKSPIYISGVGIECVFLPCWLDDNYNADNYEQFKEELRACYIQDEADKAARKEKREAKKNAETMTEIKEGETINGFYAYLSGREYFLKTDNKRVTKKVVEHFIKAVGIVKGKNADTIEKMTTLKENVDYTKGRIYKATLKKNTIGNYTFIDIDGDNFSYGGNVDELKDKLYIFDFDALTPITFYQDEEKTNAADIVADPETTNETTAADVMSATNTDTAATTETANNDNITATNNRKKILHGFYMTFKNHDIFVATNEDMKRRYIVQAFISEMINISNHLQNITEEKRNNILNDEDVLNETKKRITPATIEEIWTYQENHIRITSDNNNMIVNHSLNNFKTIVIDCFNTNEGITPTQEKSLKFFSGISRLNNQLTETITQDIKADLQADNRQTETTQDTTPKHTATKTKKAVSLFIVKDKPQPVKLPHLKPLNNIPMFQERFKTDFKPLKNNKGYNTRVKELKPLKKACNGFEGTVSCYNDKCAIGGKVAAGNTS